MTFASYHREEELWRKGMLRVGGVDEAGRGPLAGPVVAAAVVLKERIAGLRDSKQLPSSTRKQLFQKIKKGAVAVGVGIVSEREITRTNILKATLSAMRAAVNNLKINLDYLLIDGTWKIPGLKIAQEAIPKGDQKVASIAAASIVAKVTRDRLMKKLDENYPGYGFARHKGYATKEHLEKLAELGPTPAHRITFSPVRDFYFLKLFPDKTQG